MYMYIYTHTIVLLYIVYFFLYSLGNLGRDRERMHAK